MASSAGRNKLQLLCYLLLVATLMIVTSDATNAEGDVLAARPFSPSTLEKEEQGLARPEAAAAAGSTWITPLLKEQISGRRRRQLVGSRAPTCTYNECRGCRRRRCSAHEVPVDASDPMNSAYHYKCICHM